MPTLLHADLTYYLRGVGFQIHNALGAGHREIEYEKALAYKLGRDGVHFLQQPVYTMCYRGKQVGYYRPDFTLADGRVQVELKATPNITAQHKAQVLSYLAVTQAELGFIMNFGAGSMQHERLPNFLHARQPSPIRTPPANLLHSELTTPVLQALHTVHTKLGAGFIQQIYRRATRIELSHRGLAADYIKLLPIRFEGHEIGQRVTRFFLIEQKLLLSTVALTEITPTHTSHLRWAMRELDCALGLIANFYPSQVATRFVRIR